MNKKSISEILEMKLVSKALALKIAFILLLLSFAAFLVFNKRSLIGTGYELNDWVDEYVTIDKNGIVIVDATVLDFVNQAGYLMILRSPANSSDCISSSNQIYTGTYFSRRTEYFLVNLKTDQLTGPLSKVEFQTKLKKLKIKEPTMSAPNGYNFTSGTYEDWLMKCQNKQQR